MALRIVVAGEIYIDQVFSGFDAWPRPGEEAFATSLTREAGGGAIHTAAGLARLGRDVILVGPVGNDPWLYARLEKIGLRTDWLRVHESELTGVTAAVSMPDERTFFTYRGANKDVDATLPTVPEADHLHVAAACDGALLRWLCTKAKTVSIDAGWHPDWLRNEDIRGALREVAWFLPNEIEAAALTGETAPESMLKRFDELGIRAVVKLGRAGSAALMDGRLVCVPAIDVSNVDTTGAGDCFNAGFLDAWLRGEPVDSCLADGNICGALSTRKIGGIDGFPTRQEVNEWRSKSR